MMGSGGETVDAAAGRLDDERADAAAARLVAGAGEHHEEIGLAAVGDEVLRAGDPEAAALRHARAWSSRAGSEPDRGSVSA